MPINLENVVARALAARAVGPAFLAWRAEAQREQLFCVTFVAVRRQLERVGPAFLTWRAEAQREQLFRVAFVAVRRQLGRVREYRSLRFERKLRCFCALAGKPQPQFTLQV